MDYQKIIDKYYPEDDELRKLLIIYHAYDFAPYVL